MKIGVLTLFLALCLILLCGTSLCAMKEGVKLKANDAAIDVNIGHLVPCVTDWNGDGNKDLIVGQFDGGRMRLYLNYGTDSDPKFKDFTYLRAGNMEIRLPAG